MLARAEGRRLLNETMAPRSKWPGQRPRELRPQMKPVPLSSECPLGMRPVSGKSSSWELDPHHPRSGAGLSAGFPQE